MTKKGLKKGICKQSNGYDNGYGTKGYLRLQRAIRRIDRERERMGRGTPNRGGGINNSIIASPNFPEIFRNYA